MRSRLARLPLLPLVAALASFTATACSDDPTEPTFTSLTLTLSSTTVPVNGTIDITARLADLSGQPVKDGTSVTFSCCTGETGSTSNSTADRQLMAELGSITPATGTTVDGKVTAKFVAGPASGTAKIVAFSTGAKSRVIDIRIGAAAATRVTIAPDGLTIPATGGTVDVVATAVDSAGVGVAGVPVTFSADAGSFAASTVTTGATGQAIGRLTTSRQTIVTASLGGTVTATATVKVVSTPTISVAAVPTSPVAGQSAQFVYTLAVPTGSAALRDLTVNFGDSTSVTLTGLAATTFVGHVYQNPGVYVVQGTVSDVAGVKATASMVIVVQPRPAITVTMDVPPAASIVRSLPVVFNANVGPSTELPRVLRYEWDFGDGDVAVVTNPSVSHVFLLPGTRLVRVTVVTSDGLRITAQAVIVVKDG